MLVLWAQTADWSWEKSLCCTFKMAGKTESAALTHKNLVKSRIEFPAVFFLFWLAGIHKVHQKQSFTCVTIGPGPHLPPAKKEKKSPSCLRTISIQVQMYNSLTNDTSLTAALLAVSLFIFFWSFFLQQDLFQGFHGNTRYSLTNRMTKDWTWQHSGLRIYVFHLY